MPSEAIGHSGGGNIICSRRRRDQCAAPHDHHRRIEQSVPPAAAAQLQLPADPRPQQCNLIAHAVRRMRGARAPRRGARGGGRGAGAARGGNKTQNTTGLAASNEHAAPRRAFGASSLETANRLISLCWPSPVA